MRKSLAVAAMTLLAAAGPVQAQTSASATANVSVTVYRALTLSSTGSINLGIANPGAEVSLAAASSPVEFHAEGEGGASLTVTAPSSLTMSNQDGAGDFALNMVVTSDALQANQASAATVTDGGTVSLSGTVGGDGQRFFWLGVGTTTIPGAQATGLYTGTYTLSVAYN